MYVTDTPQNAIFLSAMAAVGWVFTFTAMGIRRHFPLRVDSAGNAFVAFVAFVARRGGHTLYDARDPAHVALHKHKFLVDAGAEMSLLRPCCIAFLRELGSGPAGALITALDSGIFLIAQPEGAVARISVLRNVFSAPVHVRFLHPDPACYPGTASRRPQGWAAV